MPEGELAPLFPLPPGALLNTSLLFLPFLQFSSSSFHIFRPPLTSRVCMSLYCTPSYNLSRFYPCSHFFFFALADTFQCFSSFLHDYPTFSLPPSSFLFPHTCRSRLYSCSPHDCTSQLSQSPEACWKAALKLSRP